MGVEECLANYAKTMPQMDEACIELHGIIQTEEWINARDGSFAQEGNRSGCLDVALAALVASGETVGLANLRLRDWNGLLSGHVRYFRLLGGAIEIDAPVGSDFLGDVIRQCVYLHRRENHLKRLSQVMAVSKFANSH